MTFSLMSWILGAWLMVTCLSVAVPVWKRAGQPSGPSRRSLLAGLLDAASLAGLLRLVVPWTPGSVVLWVVAIVVLAAAVAGAVLRWPELPGRSRGSGAAEAASAVEAVSGGSRGPEGAEPEESELVPKPDVAVSEVPDQSRLQQSARAETAAGQGAAIEAAQGERSRRTLLPVRERAAAPDTGKSDPGNPDQGKPGRKAAAGEKIKKEPGNLALAGSGALLLAVVVISFLAG
ncbi:hypothetical protein NNX28_11615 [Arthrobacter sp. zg-Y859]|uniref:Uncharacterized protein n=1 Tax=Arthrobacter jinronghuae TaxID=2964609 RepID=A0ABT1NS60_9MICC|nr:hypothetical protein [Arthrobacter jinronghuae]MCQ1950572.1 hypothetical protein [Arthrobacter jinronghuae]UWX77538.1 hypothetical protein N2K98_11105 [Arthrobacter jinronghuae]